MALRCWPILEPHLRDADPRLPPKITTRSWLTEPVLKLTTDNRQLTTAFYTPTGNGLGLRSSPRSRTRLSKRPCSNDINPVYQYPKTNSTRNGTVM